MSFNKVYVNTLKFQPSDMRKSWQLFILPDPRCLPTCSQQSSQKEAASGKALLTRLSQVATVNLRSAGMNIEYSDLGGRKVSGINSDPVLPVDLTPINDVPL